MKKIYQKLSFTFVIICLSILLLSNFSFATNSNDPILQYSDMDHSKVATKEETEKFAETGTMTGSSDQTRRYGNQNQKTTISTEHNRDANLKSDQSGFIAVSISAILRALAGTVQYILTTSIVSSIDLDTFNSENLFTIQKLLSGKYELFDINIFENSVTNTQYASSLNKNIKSALKGWYVSLRIIAIVLSLIVLIYIAIKMSISTIVSDKVKYKKMLFHWFAGFALLFALHYICLIVITVSDLLVQILVEAAPKDVVPFEEAIERKILSTNPTGWDTIVQAILYCVLVWYQIKFYYIYIKRVVSNAFLILISPLVTITYAIDKSRDEKAQAFNTWLAEFLTNVLIQPVHLLMFLVLLYSAGAIAATNPLIALLFFLGIGKAEKMLRTLFKLNGETIKGADEGTTFSGILGFLSK